jgi:hypothetical protein
MRSTVSIQESNLRVEVKLVEREVCGRLDGKKKLLRAVSYNLIVEGRNLIFLEVRITHLLEGYPVE